MSPPLSVKINLAIITGLLLVIAVAVPLTENAVVIYAPSTVAAHPDSADIVERWNPWRLVTFLFNSVVLYSGTKTVCASAAATSMIGASGCVFFAALSVSYALSGRFRNAIPGRDLVGSRNVNWFTYHDHNYPSIDGGMSTIEKLKQAYNGTALNVLSCLDPNQPGCTDVAYQNYPGSTGSLIHHFSASPGQVLSSRKRDCNGCAEEGSAYATDGTDFYSDYYFSHGNANDEIALGYDGSFPQHFGQAMVASTDPDFSKYYGIFCANIQMSCDQASVGFMTAYPYQLHLSQDNITANFESCQKQFDDHLSEGCISP